MNKDFSAIFRNAKPVLGMLHLKGENEKEVIDKAYREAGIMTENGVDAVIVENYFGTPAYVWAVLEDFSRNRAPFIYGVNLLSDDAENFKAAIAYDTAFMQLDSVAGHLKPADDLAFGEFIARCRREYAGCVIGGVRFKYQPYLSGRSLKEDLSIGMERCDAIAVTGEGTGMPTDVAKIKEFRKHCKGFPLIAAAGVTPDTVVSQFSVADGAIIGSYFKDNYRAEGEISKEHVRALMSAVEAIRTGCAK